MFSHQTRTPYTAAGRIPYVSLLMGVAALIIHVCHPVRPHLIYMREAVDGYEWWRILTCHLVHLNADHLLWSGVTFLILGSLCELIDRKVYSGVLLLSAVFIPLGIRIGMPALDVYGGLSGLDCAIYGLLAVWFVKRELREENRVWAMICMILFIPTTLVKDL